MSVVIKISKELREKINELKFDHESYDIYLRRIIGLEYVKPEVRSSKYDFHQFKIGQSMVVRFDKKYSIEGLIVRLRQLEDKYSMKFFRLRTDEGMFVERVK